MLKMQEIEEKLTRINGATFQDLCDAFIFYTDPLCDNIHRTGAQVGKQNTIKGTPDSYFVTPLGKYVLLEYTTQSPKPKRKLLGKVKSDIDKCIDTKKTGLQLNDIEKVIYCINSDLSTGDHKELTEYALAKGIILEIKSLTTLVLGLLSKASPLAKEFLNIAIDSGQILGPIAFIRAHERSGCSTPLGNQFIKRDTEIIKLQEAVRSSAVTILTGAPGVGKTKLVLGLFEQFKNDALPYHFFCIDNKYAPIYDDLRTFFLPTSDYIVLIDDANRQINNLKPILGLLKEDRMGKLHIIITVREYAFEEIDLLTQPYSPSIIRLEKFSDEQLTTLIGSSDFEIYNERYVKRILEIADGNPRLAIMAAKVVIEKQNFDALQDVSELYDNYFGIAIAPVIFNNQVYLKALGILAFFHSVNKEDVEHFDNILSNFGVDRFEFLQSIVDLEKLELLESSPDLQTFRIADQVLGTYFFYYTFFKKPILDFNIILCQFFISHHYRVRDTIIPVNNTFGYSNVYEKIDPYLNRFWNDIKLLECEDNALKFLEIFWLYKQDEVLYFVSTKITSLHIVKGDFVYDEEKVNLDYNGKDKYLKLLHNFFYHTIGCFKDAITLAGLYVEKKPEQYGQLVKLLRSSIVYTLEDEAHGFYRQNEFIALLVEETSNLSSIIRTRLFYDVVPVLMKASVNIVTGSRQRDAMAFCQYNLPLTEWVKKLRESIWIILKRWMSDNPIDSLLFLHEYLKGTVERAKNVFNLDKTYLVEIFKAHFTNRTFSHCFLVHEFVSWFKRIEAVDNEYDELKEVFQNNVYKLYIILCFDYPDRKMEGDNRLSYTEFQSFKEDEIREYFALGDFHQFNQFYTPYREIQEALRLFKRNYNLQFSLDIFLHEAYLRNKINLDFYFLIAEEGNTVEFVAYRIFNELSNNISVYRQFKESFINLQFKLRDLWLNNWYLLLPEDQVLRDDSREYLDMLERSTNIHYIEIRRLFKFQNVEENFVKNLLEIVYRKNSQSSRIHLQGFLEIPLEGYLSFWSLIKKTYLQQQKNDHFDYDYLIFFQLLSRDVSFLKDYFTHWLQEYSFSLREHEGVSITWNHPDAENIVEQVMDFVNEGNIRCWEQDICSVLFRKIPAGKEEKALNFLYCYVLKNKDNGTKVNSALECIRENFPDSLEPILLSFLEAQPSFNLFEKIRWTTDYMFGNANTSFGEMRANEYSVILNILEKIKDRPYRFSQHKSYIKEMIDAEKRHAVYERKRMFMRRDW